jgi:hypothetical protein
LERGKPPFQLFPKVIKSFWVELEEGLFPSSNIGDPSSLELLGMTGGGVISSVARNLLILSKWVKSPLSNLPQKDFNFIWGSLERMMSNPLNLSLSYSKNNVQKNRKSKAYNNRSCNRKIKFEIIPLDINIAWKPPLPVFK